MIESPGNSSDDGGREKQLSPNGNWGPTKQREQRAVAWIVLDLADPRQFFEGVRP